jgi:hypothetical protein
MEGPDCFSPQSGCDTAGLVPPVFSYGRAGGASITGGYVYRGTSIPSLVGKYIYGDYVSGRIWALEYTGPGTARNTLLLETHFHISTFGQDLNGEIYVCDYDAGKIFRIAGGTTRSLH